MIWPDTKKHKKKIYSYIPAVFVVNCENSCTHVSWAVTFLQKFSSKKIKKYFTVLSFHPPLPNCILCSGCLISIHSFLFMMADKFCK